MLRSLVRFSTLTDSCSFDANPVEVALRPQCPVLSRKMTVRGESDGGGDLAVDYILQFSCERLLSGCSGFSVGDEKVGLIFLAPLLCQLVCLLISVYAYMSGNPPWDDGCCFAKFVDVVYE